MAEQENLKLCQLNIPRLLTVTGQGMHVNEKVDLELASVW